MSPAELCGLACTISQSASFDSRKQIVVCLLMEMFGNQSLHLRVIIPGTFVLLSLNGRHTTLPFPPTFDLSGACSSPGCSLTLASVKSSSLMPTQRYPRWRYSRLSLRVTAVL